MGHTHKHSFSKNLPLYFFFKSFASLLWSICSKPSTRVFSLQSPSLSQRPSISSKQSCTVRQPAELRSNPLILSREMPNCIPRDWQCDVTGFSTFSRVACSLLPETAADDRSVGQICFEYNNYVGSMKGLLPCLQPHSQVLRPCTRAWE